MTKAEIANLRELARTCESRWDFAKKYGAEYRKVRKAGDLVADMVFAAVPRKVRTKYTLEELKQIAQKYKTRTAWQRAEPTSYRAASRMGILDVIAPRSLRGKWSRK